MRTLGVALFLVLAASPLTAPFSVHTPLALTTDTTHWAPKKAADDHTTDVRPPSAVPMSGLDWVAAPFPLGLSFVPARRQYSPPLRL